MKKILYFSLLAAWLAVPIDVVAGDAGGKIERFDNLINQLEKLRMMSGKLAIKKEADCFNAIGNRPFCSRIRKRSPIGVSFLEEYIAILTMPNSKVLPGMTDVNYKEMVEAVSKTRNDCAKNLF